MKAATKLAIKDSRKPLNYTGLVPAGQELRTAVSPHTGIKFQYPRTPGKAGRPPVYSSPHEEQLQVSTARGIEALRSQRLRGGVSDAREWGDEVGLELQAYMQRQLANQLVFDPATGKTMTYAKWRTRAARERKRKARSKVA